MLNLILRGGTYLRRHRKAWMICTLLSIGLVGCGPNDEAANNDTGQNNDLMRVGYYSNKNYDRDGGMIPILNGNDNDGPATTMLDYGAEGDRNGNQNQSRHGANIRSNFDDPQIGANDRNYHGHLFSQTPAGVETYNREMHGNISRQITDKIKKVEHVKEAETIISDDAVIIGVLLERDGNGEKARKEIQNAVQPQLRGKQLRIFTNESQYNRIKVLNNDLRNGGPTDDINHELKNMVNMKN